MKVLDMNNPSLLKAKKAELEKQLERLEQQAMVIQHEISFINGALSVHEGMEKQVDGNT